MNTMSIRLTFQQSGNNFSLEQAVYCNTLYPPSAGLEYRGHHTGLWVELWDQEEKLLYRQDVHIEGEAESFSVMVPHKRRTEYILLYAPGRDGISTAVLKLGKAEAEIHTMVPGNVDLPCDICGEGRGEVLRVTDLITHRNTQQVYTLVLLAECFTEQEQAKFLEEAAVCVNYLLSKEPFTGSFGASALNVHLVEIATKEILNPYFHTDFQEGSSLNWDSGCVRKVCDALFSNEGGPYWNFVGMIIRDPESNRKGTSRGIQIAVTDFGLEGQGHYYEAFQHELGHCAFGLGDEYSGDDVYEGGEPVQPNLTRETERTKIKWNEYLPKDRLPMEDTDPSVVGLCKGGTCWYQNVHYHAKEGIYHPSCSCAMNIDITAGGQFCTVCSAAGAKVLARAVSLSVPVPGLMNYSPGSGNWGNPSAATEYIDQLFSQKNYTTYEKLFYELESGRIGPNIKELFQALKSPVALPDDTEIREAYCLSIGLEKGLWYVIPPNEVQMYYAYLWKVGSESWVTVGIVKLPSDPDVTMYDTATVGSQLHIFCGDNRKLVHAIKDGYGRIDRFQDQTVEGLSDPPDISSVSVDYLSPRIAVVVADSLKIKAGIYYSDDHWDKFTEMPCGETDYFHIVKAAVSNGKIHIAGSCDRGTVYGVFNTRNMKWEESQLVTEKHADFFDIGARDNDIFIVQVIGTDVKLHHYNVVSQTWAPEKDLSDLTALKPTEVLTSFGAAVLHNDLHLVALINQRPKHFILNLISFTATKPFYEIDTLFDCNVGSMAVHASDSQLHLTISDVAALEEK